MESFLQKHQANVTGVLHGFDRILFRGVLRSISYGEGVDRFLGAMGVRYTQYAKFAEDLAKRLRKHAEMVARKSGRPCLMVTDRNQAKEDLARQIAEKDGIDRGLVCVLKSMEMARAFQIKKAKSGGFHFVGCERPTLHLYFYYMDREFGLMHVRLSTWLPFGIQVCLNGREYLARQLTKENIGFERDDNCFVRIDNLTRAQAIMAKLETRHWEQFLNAMGRRVNPLLGVAKLLDVYPYYWMMRESEYATDVMFRDRQSLDAVYPSLVKHATHSFNCQDVLRFLGRRTNSLHNGNVETSTLRRLEGVRVKHWAEENSLKMYNKAGSVLRVEMTINNPGRFKVLREATRKNKRCLRWVPMRKSIVDLERRVQVSRAANERYLEALAIVSMPATAREVLDDVSRRVCKDGRAYRALRPISPDDAILLRAVMGGEYLVKGFRNRDVRQTLYGDAPSSKRYSGRVTNLLRLLRGHRVIGKVSGTHYYRVTPTGQRVIGAALCLREADLSRLAR